MSDPDEAVLPSWITDTQAELNEGALKRFNKRKSGGQAFHDVRAKMTIRGRDRHLSTDMDKSQNRQAWTVYSKDRAARRSEAEKIAEGVRSQNEECETDEDSLGRIERSKELQQYHSSGLEGSAHRVVSTFKTFLNQHPDTAPDIQSAGIDIGSATWEEVNGALLQLQKDTTIIGKYRMEINSLKQKLREVQQPAGEPSGINDPYTDALARQTRQLLRLVSVPFDVDDSNWPREELSVVLSSIDKLRNGTLTPQVHEWLSVQVTRATATDRSAREQVVWLYFQALQNASSESLAVVIGFLYHLVESRVNELLNGEQVAVSRSSALVLLRAFELLALHLASATVPLFRDLTVQFALFRPFIQEVAKESRLIMGMVDYMDSLCQFQRTSLAAHLLRNAEAETAAITADQQTLIVDGTNLIVIDQAQVRYLRKCNFFIKFQARRGWNLVLDPFLGFGDKTTTTPWAVTADNANMICSHFADALLRHQECLTRNEIITTPVSMTRDELDVVFTV